MAETAWERKKTKIEDSGASIERLEHHQPVPSKFVRGGPTVKGIQRAWFGGGRKRVYIWFPDVTSFGNIPYWDGIC